MPELVSVLMPCYNCAPYVQEAINSILTQSYPHFELLICDDASNDVSLEKINTFTDSRIRLFRNESNQGYPQVMNILFQEARGEFIMIQDADDVSHKNRLEKLLAALSKSPFADTVGSNLVKFYPNGTRILVRGESSTQVLNASFRDYQRPGLTFATLLMRREVARIHFRDLHFITRAQDIDWLFRVSEKFSFKNLDEELYYYRQHDASMSNSNTTESLHNMFFWPYLCFITKYRRENGIDLLEPAYKDSLRGYLQNLISDKKIQDPVFWQRHLAYRAKRNGNYKEAISNALQAIRSQPFSYSSYQCLYKVLFNTQL